MIRMPLLLGLILLISGCASFGEHEITDYKHTSIVYGWLDFSSVDGNSLYDGTIKQYSPPTDTPYYHIGAEKYKGGFVYYFYGLPDGAFKLSDMTLQSCLLFMCSNSIYKYDFGTQGRVASIIIKKPGVYFMGSYKLADISTGFFEGDKFEVTRAKNPPSRKTLLKMVLQDAPEGHPIVARRIKQALRRMR